jgi:hypothetical protein
MAELESLWWNEQLDHHVVEWTAGIIMVESSESIVIEWTAEMILTPESLRYSGVNCCRWS